MTNLCFEEKKYFITHLNMNMLKYLTSKYLTANCNVEF